jgi:hypothetical protein
MSRSGPNLRWFKPAVAITGCGGFVAAACGVPGMYVRVSIVCALAVLSATYGSAGFLVTLRHCRLVWHVWARAGHANRPRGGALSTAVVSVAYASLFAIIPFGVLAACVWHLLHLPTH